MPPVRFGWLPYLPIGVGLAVLVVRLQFLTFAPVKDEPHYWNAVLHFSDHPMPDLAALRGYAELTAPFAFIVFGWLEVLTGHGLVLGRWLNLVLTISTLFLISRILRSTRRLAFGLGPGVMSVPDRNRPSSLH